MDNCTSVHSIVGKVERFVNGDRDYVGYDEKVLAIDGRD